MRMNKLPGIFLSLIIAIAVLAAMFAALHYTQTTVSAASASLFVTPGGSGTACSQAAPCTLGTAITQASPGDSIYLAGGKYTGSHGAVITLTQSIALYGGWDGTTASPPVRDPANHVTILDGESTRRVVYINGPAKILLDGIDIVNGQVLSDTLPWKGAGLYANDAELTLRSVDVYSNVIDVFDAPASYAYGSGAAVEGGTLLVEDSTFHNNSNWAKSSSYGGGLSISGTLTTTINTSHFLTNDAWNASGIYFSGENSTPYPQMTVNACVFKRNGKGRNRVGSAYGGYAAAIAISRAHSHLTNNVFQENRASNDNGVINSFRGSFTLEGNAFTGNSSGRTAVLQLGAINSFTLTNNIIADNRSTHYWEKTAAIRIWGSQGRFLHNTIARNLNFSGSHRGVSYGVLMESDTAWFTNTILLSHTIGISVASSGHAILEGTLWGSGRWANGTDWGGTGSILTGTVNIWGDPHFQAPGSGNFHIDANSAAINAGVDAGVLWDINGIPRPVGAAPDIGADEWRRAVYLPMALRTFP